MRYLHTNTLAARAAHLKALLPLPDSDEWIELKEIEQVALLLSYCWGEDAVMIPFADFEEHIQNECYEAGIVKKGSIVDNNCDWNRAATECEQDYRVVEYQNTQYFVRN